MAHQEYIRFYAPLRKPLFSAIALFLLLTLVLRFSALPHLTTHYIGGAEQDAGLYVWLTKIAFPSLLNLPWFSTSAFYPYGGSLAWSDNFILPSLLAYPFVLLRLPLPLVYNTILLSALFLAGLCTFRLAFLLTGKWWPSLFAGVFFESFGFLHLHAGHPQLQFVFWIPLGVSAFFAFLRSPSLLRALILGGLIGLCFLTTVYYAIFLVVIFGVLLASFVLLHPRYLSRRDYGNLLFGGILSSLPFLPFMLPYLATKEAFGERALYEPFFFSATLSSYFSPPLISSWYAFLYRGEQAESCLFPGLLLLGMSLLTFRRLLEAKPLVWILGTSFAAITCGGLCSEFARRSPTSGYASSILVWVGIGLFALALFRLGQLERHVRFYLLSDRAIIGMFGALALFSLALSFGPLENIAAQQTPISPYALLYHLIPGFNGLRAVGRLGIITVFSFSILSAFFLAKKKSTPTWASATLCLVTFFENSVRDFPLQIPIPKPLVWKDIPNDQSAIITLPLTDAGIEKGQVRSWSDFARWNVATMLWTADGEHPTVNGYSGIRSRMMYSLPVRTRGFPDEVSLKSLSEIYNLRYVIYRTKNPAEVYAIREKALSFTDELRYLSSDPRGNILFEVHPKIRAHPDHQLFLPSTARGILHFEAQCESSCAPLLISTNVPEGKEVIFQKNQTDSRWIGMQLLIPASLSTIRPIHLTFSSESDFLIRNIGLSEKDLPMNPWVSRTNQ